MQTNIHPNLQHSAKSREIESILRDCVHCGLCNAVCPTYQLLGDELDGPRGRIYLIKNLMEEDRISAQSAEHIDRCLTCRSCESACPSGVRYGRLLDLGREVIADRRSPVFIQRLKSFFLRKLVSRHQLLKIAILVGQFLKSLLPDFVAQHVPASSGALHYARKIQTGQSLEKVLLLKGCVQKAMTPNVNHAIEYLLSLENVETCYLESESCCGALDYHLSAHKDAMIKIKQQVDRLYDLYEDVDWILSSASGCGVTIKEYPEILKYETRYHEKAKKVVSKVLDVGEYLSKFEFKCTRMNVAVHTPCTLQHGQKQPDLIETIMRRAGANLVETGEKHLCCGSAGAYSILQPDIANKLTRRKIDQLERNKPDIIVTANVGCQLQLQTYANVPVMHWVEFLATNCQV